MKSFLKGTVLAAAASTGLAGSAHAAEVLVTSNISSSTVWTNDNVYNLQAQIYVLPGATLTIQPGTIIASTTDLGGSLAVARGAQIYAMGTKARPIIMTSKADVATWDTSSGRPDPRTGTWREDANEWGNLTLMGAGYISENAIVGNVATPSASNRANMEALIPDFVGDTKVLYGGGDDDDNSGVVKYVSLRYGGRVAGLNNELNGMSVGGVGRETEIHHIDIMNNVDDGIEVWGGTVHFRHVNIWNVGDDSFDIDQGWRGTAQFGLIVQGHSLNATQGSGVGDNCFEVDGAEDSHWQPVTTASVHNFTVIGQPINGDHGIALRDNARIQFRQCLFMDLGETLVRNDTSDGDGASGYGFGGTLSFANTWSTPYTSTSPVNAPANPAAFYTVQQSGNLTEIRDSLFFNNNFGSAYTVATSVGVFAGGLNNAIAGERCINFIARGPSVLKGGLVMQPVIKLNPMIRPSTPTATTGAASHPSVQPVRYIGGFPTQAAHQSTAGGENDAWVCGWTAADAFGFIDCSVVEAPTATPKGGTGTPGYGGGKLVQD